MGQDPRNDEQANRRVNRVPDEAMRVTGRSAGVRARTERVRAGYGLGAASGIEIGDGTTATFSRPLKMRSWSWP